jgi:hypothetical protein
MIMMNVYFASRVAERNGDENLQMTWVEQGMKISMKRLIL